MTVEMKSLVGVEGALSAKDIRRAEAREAYTIGKSPRLHPLELSEVSSDLLNILERLTNVNSKLHSSAIEDRGGIQDLLHRLLSDPDAASASPEIMAELVRLPEIVRTLIRHSELFTMHTDVGVHIHSSGVLTRRDRELAILRIAWLCQAPYEWGEHVMVAKRFGFSGEDIQRVIAGPGAEGLLEHEGAILRAVDELHGDAMISDVTWATLSKQLDERQLIELPIIVGHYQTTAYYQNSLRLRLHSGNPGLKAR